MESRKRLREYEDLEPLLKRCKVPQCVPQCVQSMKRCRESEEFTSNKRMTMPSEYSELRNEMMKLQMSMNEMRQQQRLCYQIMAGQSAQIRQLEQKLHAVQHPVGEPWIQSLVHAN